jgi:hypothetical protein
MPSLAFFQRPGYDFHHPVKRIVASVGFVFLTEHFGKLGQRTSSPRNAVHLTLSSFAIKRGSSRFDSGFYWEYNHAGGRTDWGLAVPVSSDGRRRSVPAAAKLGFLVS